MINIVIAGTSVGRRFILFFISSQMIFSLGSADYSSDINIVEGTFAIMARQAGFGKVFRRDPFCGLISSANSRLNKCQEVLNSEEFKNANAEIIYDSDKAELPKKKCQSSVVSLTKEAHIKSLSGRKISMKMFQCPFKKKNGSEKGVYLMSRGPDSNTVFLYNTAKQPVGCYVKKPVKKNTKKTK